MIFILVPLKLKLLQSTRQGDFSSLNNDLIHYNQKITTTQPIFVTNNNAQANCKWLTYIL